MTTSTMSAPAPSGPVNRNTLTQVLRMIVGILPLAGSIAVLTWGFFFLRDMQGTGRNIPQLAIALFAIVWGVGGTGLLFTTANIFVEQLPENWTRFLQPFVFIGPAIAMLTWALVIPTVRTMVASFYNESSKNFVGLKNFAYVFSNPAMLTVFRDIS